VLASSIALASTHRGNFYFQADELPLSISLSLLIHSIDCLHDIVIVPRSFYEEELKQEAV
jgi:hypothetical protein